VKEEDLQENRQQKIMPAKAKIKKIACFPHPTDR
jgi:hypothetical protein